MHCKKNPSPFPGSQPGCHVPNSFKPRIYFPYEAWSFPNLEISQNSFEKNCVPDRRLEFSRIFLFSSREFFIYFLDNSFVYLFPTRSFPGFPFPWPGFSLEFFPIVVDLIN
jgi:hypothetical protein